MGGKALGGRKINIAEAEQLYQAILKEIQPICTQTLLCGSARRGKKLLGDIDIVFAPNCTPIAGHPDYYMSDWLTERFGLKKNGKPQNVGLIDGVQVEFYEATPETWGSSILMWTGSMWNNIKLRKVAKAKGLKLSQHGLFDGDTNLAAMKSEQEIFEILERKYLEPWER